MGSCNILVLAVIVAIGITKANISNISLDDPVQNPPVSSDWLNGHVNFSRDHAGIIFSLYHKSNSSAGQQFSPEAVHLLLQKVAINFKKVVLLLHADSPYAIGTMFREIWSLQGVMEQFETTLIALPHVPLRRASEWQVSLKSTGIGSLVSLYALPFIGNETKNLKNYLLSGVFRGWDKTEYKLGYTANISICDPSSMTPEESKAVEETLSDEDATALIIFFEESIDTVNLGASEMFRQRITLLEQCRQWAQRRNFDRLTLSFMMLHYGTDSSFYERKSNIANFVGYWNLMNDWAKTTNTTIFLNNAMDGHRKLREGEQPVQEIGWWRYQDGQGGNEMNKNVWVDKVQDALLRFPEANASQPVVGTSGLKTHEIVLVSMLPVLFSIVVVILALYLIRRNSKQTGLSKGEIDDFFNGKEIFQYEEGTVDALYKAPYDKSKYELETKAVKVDADVCLGSGEFGKVCRGEIHVDGRTVTVAIKMVNPENIHKSTISSFLSEIKVLSHVGKHENIIELLGANTQHVRVGKVFIYLELCELGSLEKYLRTLRPSAVEMDVMEHMERYQNISLPSESTNLYSTENYYVNCPQLKLKELDASIALDLYRWSQEICNGMEYLATKHVVHADLATRNVLLNTNKVAKICDFGLSRRMYNYTNYVKQKQEPLPWKWMSPESLKLLQFSEKSDVWAYGITLWEIYSLGDQPYPGLSWNLQFADMLENGFRLGKPEYNSNDMYEVMIECWNPLPQYRPSFMDLMERFNI